MQSDDATEPCGDLERREVGAVGPRVPQPRGVVERCPLRFLGLEPLQSARALQLAGVIGDLQEPADRTRLGFGRIVASETEVPNMFAIPVRSG